MYTENSIYITGVARLGKDNYVNKLYENLLLVLIVDSGSGRIIDVECRTSLEITKKFLKYLFLDEIITNEKKITNMIETKYFGESTKAFIVAYKNALQNYKRIKM